MNPKVSIITSTYQRPVLLKRAIESMQAQTFDDWEMIIVYDGDPDALTLDMISKLNDDRVYFTNVDRFGNHSRPKNHGTKLSCGKYIGYLDDDVAYRPNHLSTLVNILESNANVDIAYGSRMMIDGGRSYKGHYKNFNSDTILRMNFIDTSDSLIRRDAIFAIGGWDENYQKYLDWNLWTRLSRYGFKFLGINSVLTDYYITPGSMLSQPLDSLGEGIPAWDLTQTDIVCPFLKEVKVCIFTLTYDRLDETRVAFDSLCNTSGYLFNHIIVDNGSTDDTPSYLESYSKHVIYNPDNKGISIGSNQALDLIGKMNPDIIGKVDNDAIFKTRNWLKRMVDIWIQDDKMILSCAVTGLRDNPNGSHRYDHTSIALARIGLVKHLGGIVCFSGASAYDEFRWPESDVLHGDQDLTFSNYAVKKGYTLGYLEDYLVNHGIDGTAGQYERYADYFSRRKLEKITTYEME